MKSNKIFRAFISIGVLVVVLCFNHRGVAQDARLVAKSVLPSVVKLEMRDENNQPMTLGSGFFVRADVIVTNFHVISGASAGIVTISGSSSQIHIDGVTALNKQSDLALLRVSNVRGIPLKLADISKIEVGQEVFAIGNPQGLDGTISPGIISSSSLREVGGENLLQITAPISPGSSGGPVVNRQGEVIGVAVSSLKTGQNLNFAIPSTYLEILLASPQKLRTLAEVNESVKIPEREDNGPSYAETAAWLTSKLEGFKYTAKASTSQYASVVTLDTLRFPGCQTSIVVRYTMGNLVTLLSTRVPLDLVSDVTAESSQANTFGIWLILSKKVNQVAQNSDGPGSSEFVSEVKVPVSDLDLGERGVKAFKQLARLCKDNATREPY